ncbi:hypothetical protein [Aquimarina litoralis]|uniref:hypothetical protein n=1 Tax=Aquimarina litoralis TaxID=584605 RepID=UPI001C58E1B4|nr:hypothetical protein [Aquimarina litoralis]
MLKHILSLSKVSILSKRNQSRIQGGFLGSDCLELPPECGPNEFLFECTCVDENTGFPG